MKYWDEVDYKKNSFLKFVYFIIFILKKGSDREECWLFNNSSLYKEVTVCWISIMIGLDHYEVTFKRGV